MPRSLDHLVVAVRDLDAAASFYEKLGFQVGARNRHPWGTENRLIRFPGSFIELITVAEERIIPAHGPRSFSFGAFVKDYLTQREGCAMLVLQSRDAKADAQAFTESGIGDFEPFFFERRGRRLDGSETHVAFSLAFARDEQAPAISFFVCQQEHPESFWNPVFQQHPNAAEGLTTVVMAAPNPSAHERFLSAFTDGIPTAADATRLTLPLSPGRLEVLTPDVAQRDYGPLPAESPGACFIAFTITVPELERVAAQLETDAIPIIRSNDRIRVPAHAAFGVAITFEARSTR